MEFQTIQDVLTFAISLERISQRFYQELSGRVTDAAVGEFLAAMSREERLHEEQLRTLVEDGGLDLSGQIPAGEIQSYIQAMEVPDEMDYKKAVKIAYEKEKASQMLYSILSGMVEADPLKRLLIFLSAQEKKHKDFFAGEYNRIRLGEN